MKQKRLSLRATVGAVGVVFGDIGTSPGKTRAPGDQDVTRQTTLATYEILPPNSPMNASASPLPMLNVQAQSLDLHPDWSSDEKYIYFTSNRVSNTDTSINPTNTFNIYRMFPDGSGVTQLTTGNDQKLEPNIATDGFRLAYVAGGTPSFAADLSLTTSGFNLYYINLASGTVTSLTQRNPQNLAFLDVRHPSWAPGGNQIAFAGLLNSDRTHYHIFKVNTDTNVITQMTTGAANDTAPAWSPDGNVIAFTSNATKFNPSGANAAVLAAGTKATTDIFVVSQNLFLPDSTQVTNSAFMGTGATGIPSNNRNPAWSTLRSDILGNIPNVPDPTGMNAKNSQQLLAFASDRIFDATTGTFTTRSANGSTDIYFVNATVDKDAANPNPALQAAYTVTTPESKGNPGIMLQTSTTGFQNDPAPTNTPEYASNFDPNHTTTEDYPTWPQYISSYRIYFQSNKGNNLDIWGSTILDVNAPTLIKYDIPNNQVVGVFRDSPNLPKPGSDSNAYGREFAAGDKVRFRVRAADYESGVQSVWLQIKCPESAQQSADNMEHKIFFDGAEVPVPFFGAANPISPHGALDGSTAPGMIAPMQLGSNGAPIEWDAQAINPATYAFQAPGTIAGSAALLFTAIPTTWPGFNTYMPGTDDAITFTGSAAPPDTTFWLQLFDNGDSSVSGNEPTGELKGDGVYTATWTTPAALPSDWYLDVIVYDKAIDPFNPMFVSNWKIYDNVWGFTTKPFQVDPRASILYVNDYDCGQKFFAGTFGSFFRTNGATVLYPGVPTESWMTELSEALLPATWYTYTPGSQAAGGPLLNVLNNLGQDSYGANGLLTTFPTAPVFPTVGDLRDSDGSVIPPTQRYAQWRILCRGPVPDSVLNAFAPHVETQPADQFVPGSQPRQVTVAERCVIWHSPYTGDLFVGPGTIIDTGVQNQLRNFVAKGGRLFLSGQDVAWALSGATPGASTFLTQVFHVQYATDAGGTPNVGTQGGEGIHPIATETWFNGPTHFFPNAGSTYDPPSSGIISLFGYQRGQGYTGSSHELYGCPNDDSPDTITFVPEQAGVAGVDGFFGTAASPNIVWYSDATQNSKVVFSCLPWEAICPDFFDAPNPPNPPMAKALKNRRTELTHNVMDYLRTGRIIGNVRTVNGAGIFTGVFIRAVDPVTGLTAGTTVSQSDGSYVIDGLAPTGIYTIDAYSPGFIAQHFDGDYFHGAWQVRVDIFLTPAQPGSISGSVIVLATGAPVPGAIVVATDPLSGKTYSATTGTDGTFRISNVPAITDPANPGSNIGYIVRVSNITALGYGSSNPSTFGLFSTDNPANFPNALNSVQVASGQDVQLSTSFKLIQLPGSVTGKVTSRDANGVDTGKGIAGATVTAVQGMTTLPAVTTDTNGNYTIANVPPGSYQVTAAAAGFTQDTEPVIVASNVPTTQNFALFRAAPGSVSGSVTAQDVTQFIAGATVSLLDAAGNPLKDQDGNVIPSVTTTGKLTNGTYTYNYKFSSVPSGSVQVTVSKPGYTNASGVLSITVASNQETQNVNFVLNPKATFEPGLRMVSTPQDYTTPIQNLLTFSTPSDAAKTELFWWNPAKRAYDKNPTPPADTFHRGVGYFLYVPNGATLTTEGTGDDTMAFSYNLQAGWNIIGVPYSFPVDYTKLSVIDNGATVTLDAAQSGTNPALGGGFFTYSGTAYIPAVLSLDAYTGYWIRAFRPVTLWNPSAKLTRAPNRAASGNNSDGWTLNLMAQAGDQSAAPGYLGINRAATDGFDRFKLETPPPTMNAQSVTLSFAHSDWGDKSGNYTKDVRSPAQTSQVWQFTVTSNVTKTPVTLRWPSVATVPGKQNLMLTDIDSNVTINLRNRGSYVIPASDSPITRHFKLALTRAGHQKLQVADVVAHNNGSSRAVGVVISYRLTEEADVQINIMQNGRKVRTLEPNSHRAAGASDTTWDMRDDKGVSVAGNTYTVEVRATDTDGNVARQVTPLLITR